MMGLFFTQDLGSKQTSKAAHHGGKRRNAEEVKSFDYKPRTYGQKKIFFALTAMQ
jgi:hypothetical protein